MDKCGNSLYRTFQNLFASLQRNCDIFYNLSPDCLDRSSQKKKKKR